MKNKSTFIGTVQDVRGTTISVVLSNDSLSGLSFIDGHGYRIGQIGTFVKIPIGYIELFGIVSQVGASAIPENKIEDIHGNRWMTIQLIGEGQKNSSFERGISQFPTISDEVHLVSKHDLEKIYGQPNKPYFVKVGNIAGAESIPALLDINKLVTRHCAVVGTTGSGKSTTVASLINSISSKSNYPASRVIVFDIHGEYGNALKDNANVFKVGGGTLTKDDKQLVLPFWSLSFDELVALAFGNIEAREKGALADLIYQLKKKSFEDSKFDGVNETNLSVDTPIPFSIRRLWFYLHRLLNSTHTNPGTGQKIENIDESFNPSNSTEAFLQKADLSYVQIGDADKLVSPLYQQQVDKKIYLSASSLNLRRQNDSLLSKLKDPRYDFLFKPGEFSPDLDGKIKSDLDELFKSWIGSEKNITIFDLSGIPSSIMNTIIGILLRILFDSLFWTRNLSQGGRHRPLFVVMEEAHNYLNDNFQGLASSIVQRIAKEGRKYGIGAMIVSQRPSEINSTILSQCGTFIALRLSNSTDRSHISGAISDNLEGLTSMLPILKTGEAIILGESVKLPMRTFIEPPPKEKRPDSQDPIVFDEKDSENSMNPGGWGIPNEKSPNYKEFIEVWRSQNQVLKPKKK